MRFTARPRVGGRRAVGQCVSRPAPGWGGVAPYGDGHYLYTHPYRRRLSSPQPALMPHHPPRPTSRIYEPPLTRLRLPLLYKPSILKLITRLCRVWGAGRTLSASFEARGTVLTLYTSGALCTITSLDIAHSHTLIVTAS
jgi:hypothetical protein